MKKGLISFIFALIIGGATMFAGSPVWEEVASPQPNLVQSLSMERQTEVIVRDGYIYISTQEPVTVKIFSILGQQIHQETVPAGLHRLRLNSKGIYILKAGSLTKRITL